MTIAEIVIAVLVLLAGALLGVAIGIDVLERRYEELLKDKDDAYNALTKQTSYLAERLELEKHKEVYLTNENEKLRKKNEYLEKGILESANDLCKKWKTRNEVSRQELRQKPKIERFQDIAGMMAYHEGELYKIKEVISSDDPFNGFLKVQLENEDGVITTQMELTGFPYNDSAIYLPIGHYLEEMGIYVPGLAEGPMKIRKETKLPAGAECDTCRIEEAEDEEQREI